MAKRNIKVREQELIDRLNNVLNPKKKEYQAPCATATGVDTADGQDKTSIPQWYYDGPVEFEDRVSGNPRKLYENEKVVEVWQRPPECEIPQGEITINLDPVKNMTEEEKKTFEAIGPCSLEDIHRDTIKDAEESRTGVANSILPMPNIRKTAEDICYKRIKREEPKLAALKRALDECEDTQPRTLNTEGYEYVNHPQHYNNYNVEVIDMMRKIFGSKATYQFCLLNAFKYRMRAGTKPNISAEQDLAKEQWYLKKAAELKQLLDNLR
jgi:hypothetical protein